jgi:hypothetical protein
MIDVTKETEKLKRELEDYKDAKTYDQPEPRAPRPISPKTHQTAS